MTPPTASPRQDADREAQRLDLVRGILTLVWLIVMVLAAILVRAGMWIGTGATSHRVDLLPAWADGASGRGLPLEAEALAERAEKAWTAAGFGFAGTIATAVMIMMRDVLLTSVAALLRPRRGTAMTS